MPTTMRVDGPSVPARPTGRVRAGQGREEFSLIFSDAAMASRQGGQVGENGPEKAGSTRAEPGKSEKPEDRRDEPAMPVSESGAGDEEREGAKPTENSRTVGGAGDAEETSSPADENPESQADVEAADSDSGDSGTTAVGDANGDSDTTDTTDSEHTTDETEAELAGAAGSVLPSAPNLTVEAALLQALGATSMVNASDLSGTTVAPGESTMQRATAPVGQQTQTQTQTQVQTQTQMQGQTDSEAGRSGQATAGDPDPGQPTHAANNQASQGHSDRLAGPQQETRADSDGETTPVINPRMSKQELRREMHVKAHVLEKGAFAPADRATGETTRVARAPDVAEDLAKLLTDASPSTDDPAKPRASSVSPEGEAGKQPATSAAAETTGAAPSGQGNSMPGGAKVISVSGQAGATAPVEGMPRTNEEAIDRIVRVTQASAGQQQSHVRLQLEPPELGQVRIDVKIVQGALDISIRAETHAAKDLLQSRFDGLRQGLAEHGLQVNRFEVELRNSHQPNPDPRDPGSDQSGSRNTSAHQQLSEQSGSFRDGAWHDSYRPDEEVEGIEKYESEDDEAMAVGVDVTV